MDEHTLRIIQDYTRITDTLDAVCCALENDDVDMPNFVPMCEDQTTTEQLQYIIEHLKGVRNG